MALEVVEVPSSPRDSSWGNLTLEVFVSGLLGARPAALITARSQHGRAESVDWTGPHQLRETTQRSRSQSLKA